MADIKVTVDNITVTVPEKQKVRGGEHNGRYQSNS